MWRAVRFRLTAPNDVDYWGGRLIDNSGKWLGERKDAIGQSVGQFIQDHPGAGIALNLADVALKVYGGPARAVAGYVLDSAKDTVTGWVSGGYADAGWNEVDSRHGGEGIVLGASLIVSGLGAIRGGIAIAGKLSAAEGSIPTIGGRLPINSRYAGQVHPSGVEFTEQGFPNFRPYSQAEVEIPNLTGKYGIDSRLANEAMGYPSTPKGYVWHHVEDGATMQLIPKSVHNSVRHTGGAAVIRNGGFD